MIHNKILASFIIPIYNTEKYLERCLNSVTAIASRNIEIIVVDDGSTDNSSSVYERYARIDNRITIIKKENGGVSSARNRGMQEAVGEWITFIDSDDEIVPAVYHSVLMKLDGAYGLWMFGVRQCYLESDDFAGKIMQGIWFDEDIEVIKRGIFHYDMVPAKKMRKQGFDFRGPVGKFYNKEVITKNNLVFHESLTIGEDCVFNFLYLNCINTISYTNECGYYYWQNSDSVIHKFKEGKGKQYMDTVEYVSDILGERGYLLEYAQYGVREYLHALNIDWCHPDNHNKYSVRRNEAMQWRNKPFVQKAFNCLELSQMRYGAMAIAFCAKMKCFLLCDFLLKMKNKLHIRFR